eukprot:11574136-Alexandrium_andersonii.AAC.1
MGHEANTFTKYTRHLSVGGLPKWLLRVLTCRHIRKAIRLCAAWPCRRKQVQPCRHCDHRMVMTMVVGMLMMAMVTTMM